MKYPIRTAHPGLSSPPSDIDLLTGSPVRRTDNMAGAVSGSAVVMSNTPASPPPSPPELPTAARQDVPRSVPQSLTDCGNHYIYLRDPSVPRNLRYSIVKDRGGENSAGVDQNCHGARFCLSANEWTEGGMGYNNGQLPGATRADRDLEASRSVINGGRRGERGSADRTPTAAPELRSHGEGPERFFPSRDASSSPHRYHNSSGATTSAKTASHRQAGVDFVPITRGKSVLLLYACQRCLGQKASRTSPSIRIFSKHLPVPEIIPSPPRRSTPRQRSCDPKLSGPHSLKHLLFYLHLSERAWVFFSWPLNGFLLGNDMLPVLVIVTLHTMGLPPPSLMNS
jgi:hypothetical protein